MHFCTSHFTVFLLLSVFHHDLEVAASKFVIIYVIDESQNKYKFLKSVPQCSLKLVLSSSSQDPFLVHLGILWRQVSFNIKTSVRMTPCPLIIWLQTNSWQRKWQTKHTPKILELRNCYLMSVCVCGTNLSRALNLRHSGLAQIFKPSTKGLQGALKQSLSGLQVVLKQS